MTNKVTIQLQVNLRGLVGVEKLNTALANLNKTVGGMGRAFGKGNAAAVAQQRVLGQLVNSANKINAAQGKVAASTTKTVAATKKLTDAERAAAAQERKLVAEQERRKKMMETLGGRLRMYEQDVDALFRAGYRLQMLGTDLQQIGRRTMDFLSGLSTSFGEFEYMALRAGGAMGVMMNATSDQEADMGDLESAILDSARALRLFDPTEVAEATYYWASTTGQAIKTQKDLQIAMEGVAPIMKAAAMTNTDYETAIKGVYSIIVQYGKNLNEVADVTEKLFKATNITAAEFPDLVNSFKMVGPIAKENGVTFEQMVEQFGRLADVGIRGTMVGRAFRQLFIQLNKPSKQAKEALDDLWASTEQFAGKSYEEMVFPKGQFVGINKYVDMLADATKDLTQAERNHILAQITTANELPVLTALVSKQVNALKGLGEGWDSAKYGVKNASEYFDQAWGKLSDSWKGLTSSISTGVEIIRIQLGSRLATIVRPVLEEFRKLLDNLSKWIDDPANAGIIDFFTKVTVAVGALAGGVGILASFAGGMIAAGAAASLMFRAFKPLFGVMGGFAGVFALAVKAVIENIGYLQSAADKITKNLNEIFREGSVSVEKLQEAFTGLTDALVPILGVLVRTVADIVVAITDLAAALSKNEAAMSVFGVAVKVISVLMASKLLVALLGVAVPIGKLLVLLGKLKFAMFAMQYGAYNLITNLKNIGTNLKNVSITASGMKGAFKNIFSMGGISLMIAGFALLYDNVEEFKGAVDNAALALRDFRKEADEIFSPSSPKATQTRNLLEERFGRYIKDKKIWEGYASDLRHNIRDLFGGTLYLDERGFVGGETQAKMADRWVQQMLTEIDQAAKNVNAPDSTAFGDMVLKTLTVNGDDLDKAIQSVQAYFIAINGQALEGNKDLTAFTSAMKSLGMTPDDIDTAVKLWDIYTDTVNGASEAAAEFVPPERVLSTADQAVMDKLGQIGSYINTGTNADLGYNMLAQMIDQRDQYGPKVNEVIDDWMNSLSGNAVVAVEEAADEIAEAAARVPGDIARSLLDSGKALHDLPHQLAEIMKTALSPNRQMSGIFRDFLDGTISRGFRDAKDGHFHVEAQLLAEQGMEDAMTQWETYAKEMSPPDLAAIGRKIIKSFNKSINKAIPATVPDEQRQQLEDYITTVYGSLGKPVPQSVLDKIWKTSKNAGDHTTKGFKKGVVDGKGNVTKAVSTVLGIVNDLNNFPSIIWGQHFLSNFTAGINRAKADLYGAVNQVARGIAARIAFTVPKIGPLHTADEWGGHMIDNIVRGIDAGLPDLIRSANDVADAIAISQDAISAQTSGITMESSSRKTMDINIKVTSPDGSVDRVKASQIEQSLMSSDLVLSLEHMATVG